MSGRHLITDDPEADGLLADALAAVDRRLRLGIALRDDRDLRAYILAGRSSATFQLPLESGWIVVEGKGLGLLRTHPSSGVTDEFSAILCDSTVSKRALEGPAGDRHAKKSEALIRGGLLASDRALFRGLEAWSPLIETNAYGFGARVIEILDHLREETRTLRRPRDGRFARIYWLLVSILGRATLLSTGEGASVWLTGMAKSFEWNNWTPSFALLRDRSLWCALVGARAAAAVGPSIIDRYAATLSRAEHPIKAVDAIMGLIAIALKHGHSRAEIDAILKRERRRLDKRLVITPQFFLLAYAQAQRILSEKNGVEPDPARPPSFRADALEVDAAGDMPSLAMLRKTLGMPAWRYLPSSASPSALASLSPEQCKLMFERAWGPEGASLPSPSRIH